MGVIGIIVKVVVGLVLVIVGLGAYLYFTDYEAKATITDRSTDAQCAQAKECWIVVSPNVFPGDYKKTVDPQTLAFVCKGYQVSFHINTQNYQVFDTKSALIYDSEKGLVDPAAAARCSATGGIVAL